MDFNKHICLLTSSYPATYSRFLNREAKSLAQIGFRVTLIGLGEKMETCEFNGIKVIKIKERQKFQKVKTLVEIARMAIAENADIYHCIDPWCLIIGFTIKKRKPMARLIYESSEWFPQQYLDRSNLPLFIRVLVWLIISYFEYKASHRADAVIETNLLRAQRFIRRGANLQIVPNYPPLTQLKMPVEIRNPWFIYTGLICRPRGFDRLLMALTLVKPKYPRIKLIVRGEFDPRDNIEQWVKNYIKQHQLEENVQFVEHFDSYEKIFELLETCLCGVILLQPKRGNDWTNQPNKLFEFMNAGLAVIASNFPEIARIVNETKCGWLIDPTRPEEIAWALEQVLADPKGAILRGIAGRKYVETKYNWSIAEKTLTYIYRQLTN